MNLGLSFRSPQPESTNDSDSSNLEETLFSTSCGFVEMPMSLRRTAVLQRLLTRQNAIGRASSS
jgi:hypothetical protein